MESAQEIQAEIDRLIPQAESGEDWAHICALELQIKYLGTQIDPDSQFGVGA